MQPDTIYGALVEPPVPRPFKQGMDAVLAASCARWFKIKAAEGPQQRRSVNGLIGRRYEWRGYGSASLPETQTADRITLSATVLDVPIGTITVGMEVPEKLHATETFPAEIASLHARGHKVCEFTKLAVDPTHASRRVLASLFHVAYVLAHRLRGYDTLVMEVNPRHVGYYKKMLGCRVLGAERMNPRVDAPAVLLTLELAYVRQQIGAHNGPSDLAPTEHSLYSYAFDAQEEERILGRMK